MKIKTININGVDFPIVDDYKRCLSCKFCRSALGDHAFLYCSHPNFYVYLCLVSSCPFHKPAYAF